MDLKEITGNILFLDIETAAQFPDFNSVPPITQELWAKKTELRRKKEEITPEEFYKTAGIYAEFGRIVCISAGYFLEENDKLLFKIKSFYNKDEKQLLKDFSETLEKFYSQPDRLLCAHNGKEFDFPYISRRMLINGIKIPDMMDYAGKKPWEVPYLDTLELWKFGDHKNFTSLNLMASVFGMPSPKDDRDGSMVNDTFWKENDMEKIVTDFEKDVFTL
ncbi:MAG: ribonuclease H-like domain-containing protein, partial [Bacteroidia bacterium]